LAFQIFGGFLGLVLAIAIVIVFKIENNLASFLLGMSLSGLGALIGRIK